MGSDTWPQIYNSSQGSLPQAPVGKGPCWEAQLPPDCGLAEAFPARSY